MTPVRCPFEDDVLLLADSAAAGPDAIPSARRFVVEAHLAVCPSCAATEDALELAATAMRAATVPSLGAADAALAQIARERSAASQAFSRRRVAAAAILGVAAVAIAGAALSRSSSDATPRTVTQRGPASVERPSDPAPRANVTDNEIDAAPRDPPMPEGPAVATAPRSLDDLAARIDALDPDAPADDPALADVVRRVAAAGTSGAWALAGLIDGGRPERAVRAAVVAERVRSSQFVAPLGALLRPEAGGRAVEVSEGIDDALATNAARALATIGTPAAVEQLVAALDGASRHAALAALVTCRSPRTFDALADRVRSGRDSDPAEILDAAIDLSPRESARLVLDLSADRALAAVASAALRAHAAELAPHLVPLAARGDGLVTAAAVRALGETRDPSALATLRSAATRPGLARAAADALVAIGTDDSFAAAFDVAADPRSPRDLVQAFDGAAAAVRVLARSLTDPRLSRRLAATDALGWTRSIDAVEPLVRAARDTSVRHAAIDALGRIRGDASALALATWARPKTADPALVAALGATGSPFAVPSLKSLARETALTTSAARALGGIEHAESVLALAELLAEPRAARAAAESLASMPAGVVVPALLGRLDDSADATASTRARRALVLVAGADLGRTPDAWHTWWDDRRPRTQEEPR